MENIYVQPVTPNYFRNEKLMFEITANSILFDVFFNRSETKFDSHCGWPAFSAASNNEADIARHEDRSHGMIRVEVTCKKVIYQLIFLIAF